MYAGATAGGGISAEAGLAGHTGAEGSTGGAYAGATAGGVGVLKSRTKEVELSSPLGDYPKK